MCALCLAYMIKGPEMHLRYQTIQPADILDEAQQPPAKRGNITVATGKATGHRRTEPTIRSHRKKQIYEINHDPKDQQQHSTITQTSALNDTHTSKQLPHDRQKRRDPQDVTEEARETRAKAKQEQRATQTRVPIPKRWMKSTINSEGARRVQEVRGCLHLERDKTTTELECGENKFTFRRTLFILTTIAADASRARVC